MAFIYDWQRLAGKAADNDLIMLIDVSDKAMSDEGSNKLIEGKYIVYATDGLAAGVTGGGTINLGGQTLNIVSGGSLDLSGQTLDIGGNVSIDAVFSIVGDTMTIDGKAFRIVTAGNIDLTGKTLSVNPAGDNLLIDGVALPQYSPNGTIDLGGSTMTADGAGTLTLDGDSITVADVIEGVPGDDTELAVFTATGALQGAGIKRGAGDGVITLSSDATGATVLVEPVSISIDGNKLTLSADLTIESEATLNFNGQKLTLLNTGGDANLALYGNRLMVSGGDMHLRNGGELDAGGNKLTLLTGDIEIDGGSGLPGKLILNSQTLTLTGTGSLDLGASKTLSIDEDINLDGGGTLNLDGFTVTAPKSGDIAMLTDILSSSAANPIQFNGSIAQSYTSTNYVQVNNSLFKFNPADYPDSTQGRIKITGNSANASSYYILKVSSTFNGVATGLVDLTGDLHIGVASGAWETAPEVFTLPTVLCLMYVSVKVLSGGDATFYDCTIEIL